MTIGEKIKNARNLRGLTQKELGMKLGFDEKSADVRIAQYESGTRTPKSELLSEIASILDVNINSLINPSLENAETFIHLLNEFLSEWQLRRKELSDEIITEEEYAEWMLNFPATSDDCGKTEPVKKWRK